jgi:hypothetical protein
MESRPASALVVATLEVVGDRKALFFIIAASQTQGTNVLSGHKWAAGLML